MLNGLGVARVIRCWVTSFGLGDEFWGLQILKFYDLDVSISY